MSDVEREAMRLALKRCAEQFRFYEKSHREKVPPQHDKADANMSMATMCEAMTVTSSPIASHHDRQTSNMVEEVKMYRRTEPLPAQHRGQVMSDEGDNIKKLPVKFKAPAPLIV